MSKRSIVLKGSLIAMIAALALSSVALAKSPPKTAPKSAPKSAASAPASAAVLQSSWKSEQLMLKIDSFVLVRIDRFLDAVGRLNKRPADHVAGRVGVTIREVEALLARAQAIVTAHAGFDASGTVSDAAAAQKSVNELSGILRLLRGSFIYRVEHMKL